MKRLLLVVLLAGCTKAVPVPEQPVEQRIKAKYKGVNEFIMSDGCRVRTGTRYWTDGQGWLYRVETGLNNWSDKCSEPYIDYLESDIVWARYK